MMSMLRKKMKIIFIIVIFFFVAFIFLQWGLNITSGRSLKQNENIIGEAAGVKITRDFYIYKLNQLRQNYIQRTGKTSLNEDEEKMLSDQAFAQIVDNIIFSKIEKEYGYFATKEEILDIIQNVPPQELRQDERFYDEQGNFDMLKYQQLITDPANRAFYNSYYLQIKENLPLMKMRMDLFSGIKIRNDEVLRKLKLNETKYTVEYIVIPNDNSIKLTVSDNEAKEYFDNNKHIFYTPPVATIDYIKIAKTPSSQDILLAKENITGLRQDILNNNISFEQAAKMYSEDYASAQNGGNLGYIKPNETVKEFNDIAFSLKKGEISQPIKTEFGWHILRCEDRKRDSVNISHILIRIRPSYETLQSIINKIQPLLKDIKAKGFEEAAKEYNYEILSTQSFYIDQGYIPEIGPFASKIIAFVMNNKENTVSDLIDERDNFYICKITMKKEGVPDFENIKDIVKNHILIEKRRVVSSTILKDIVNSINNNNISLKQYAKNNSYNYNIVKDAAAKDEFKYISNKYTLIGAMMAADNNKVYYVTSKDNGYIFKIINRKEVDLKNSQELIDKYRQMIINEKQQEISNQWSKTLTEYFNVKDYRY